MTNIFLYAFIGVAIIAAAVWGYSLFFRKGATEPEYKFEVTPADEMGFDNPDHVIEAARVIVERDRQYGRETKRAVAAIALSKLSSERESNVPRFSAGFRCASCGALIQNPELVTHIAMQVPLAQLHKYAEPLDCTVLICDVCVVRA